MQRIELLENGDRIGMEKVAKKNSKARYCLKGFGKWEPRDSWSCDLCLLTGFDRDIEWRWCSSCQKRTHTFCQVYSDQELALDQFQCRTCSGVKGLDELKQKLSQNLTGLKASVTNITFELTKLKKEESSLKLQCSKFMGATRLKFQEILENKLKVNRADYHSSCFVGNHCDIIVEKYETITEVFASNPEVKKKYDEFLEVYKPLHFLMKSNRFLSPEELDLMDTYCEKIGEIYPKNFKTAIPPKLDDLIFVVPKFARKWNTVGGLREEKIEAFHNVGK